MIDQELVSAGVLAACGISAASTLVWALIELRRLRRWRQRLSACRQRAAFWASMRDEEHFIEAMREWGTELGKGP